MATVPNASYGAATSQYPSELHAQNQDIAVRYDSNNVQPFHDSMNLQNLSKQSSKFTKPNQAPFSPPMNNWSRSVISNGPNSSSLGRARSLSPALQQLHQQQVDVNYLKQNYQPTWVDTIEKIYSNDPQSWDNQQQQQNFHQQQQNYHEQQPQLQSHEQVSGQWGLTHPQGSESICEHHQQNCPHTVDKRYGTYVKQEKSASMSPQKNYKFIYQTSNQPQKPISQFSKYEHQNQPHFENNQVQISSSQNHQQQNYGTDRAQLCDTVFERSNNFHYHRPQSQPPEQPNKQQQTQHFIENKQHERLLMPFKVCDECQNCPCHLQNFGLHQQQPLKIQSKLQQQIWQPPHQKQPQQHSAENFELHTQSLQQTQKNQQVYPPQHQQISIPPQQQVWNQQTIFDDGQVEVPQQVYFQHKYQQQPLQNQPQQQNSQQSSFLKDQQEPQHNLQTINSGPQQKQNQQQSGHSIGYYQMLKQQNLQNQRSPISPPTKQKPQQKRNLEEPQPQTKLSQYEIQRNYQQTQQSQQQPQLHQHQFEEWQQQPKEEQPKQNLQYFQNETQHQQQQQNFNQYHNIKPQKQTYNHEHYPKPQGQQQQPLFKQQAPAELQQIQNNAPPQQKVQSFQQYYMEQQVPYVPQKQQKEQLKEQQKLQFEQSQQQRQYQNNDNIEQENEYAQGQQNYHYDEESYYQQHPIQNYQQDQHKFQTGQQLQQMEQPKVPPYIRKQKMFSPRSEYTAVDDEVGLPAGPPPTFTTRFGDDSQQNTVSYRMLSRRSKSEDPRRHHSPVPGASDKGYLYGGMDFITHEGTLAFRPDDFEMPGEKEHKRKSREELPLRRPGDHYGLDFSGHPAAASVDSSRNDVKNYHGYAPRVPRQHWKFSADPDAPLNNFEVAMLDAVDPLTLVGDTLSNQKIAADTELTDEERRQFCVEFAPPTGFRPEHRTVIPPPAETEPICMSLSAKKDKIPQTSTPAAQSQEQYSTRGENPFASTQDASWYTNGNKDLMRNEPNWSRNIVLRKQAWENDAFKEGGARQPAWARTGKVQPAQPQQQQESHHGESQRMTSSAHWVNQQQPRESAVQHNQQFQQQSNQVGQQAGNKQKIVQQQQRYPQHPQQQYAQEWQTEQQRTQQNTGDTEVDIVVEDDGDQQQDEHQINQQQQQEWKNTSQQFQQKQPQHQIGQQNRPQQQPAQLQNVHYKQQQPNQQPQQNTVVEYYHSDPSYGSKPNQISQYNITRTSTTSKSNSQPQQQILQQPQYFISKQQYKQQQPATVIRTKTTTSMISDGGIQNQRIDTRQQQIYTPENTQQRQNITNLSSHQHQEKPATIRQQIGQKEFVS